MLEWRRQTVLGVLFGAVTVLTAFLLWEVLPTVFFAITIAYIMYPLRKRLVTHGASGRLAALLSTATAFFVGVLLAAPLFSALYFRRGELFEFLRQLPQSLVLSVGEFSYTVDIGSVLAAAQAASGRVAVTGIQLLPVVALKLFLFTLVVYALLLRPEGIREGLLRPVPERHHNIVLAFHERTRSILYAIYVLQAAVAFGTFVIGLAVFLLLGYESAFALAVICGVLQFIPILGPSVVIAVLSGVQIIAGDVTGAVVIFVVGMVVIGFLPDALIRPRLARLTTGMPGSLYFVGFTGGILSVGVVGLVAGPVVVALLAEAVSLLTAEAATVQQELT
ncbi:MULTISPECIES: AI-2E family transporter [Salinibaculum]|uniref:AI-2E family transporter n=1 Tax=Salinibaculum TaxID=2732368 RepID=UPI0030CE2B01